MLHCISNKGASHRKNWQLLGQNQLSVKFWICILKYFLSNLSKPACEIKLLTVSDIFKNDLINIRTCRDSFFFLRTILEFMHCNCTKSLVPKIYIPLNYLRVLKNFKAQLICWCIESHVLPTLLKRRTFVQISIYCTTTMLGNTNSKLEKS